MKDALERVADEGGPPPPHDAGAQAAEGWLRMLFELSFDAVLVTNDERRIVDANPAACALFGRTLEDLRGRRPVDLSAPGQDAEAAWRSFRTSGTAERSWRYTRADGSLVDVVFRAVADFVPGRHLVALRDVTDRRRAERALQDALPVAAEATGPLRILIVEDNPLDAELVEHEVRRAGIGFTAERVDSREGFVEALRSYAPDVVLSDFSLPGFDALTGLRLLLDQSPDTPFIIVTGSLSQDAAVECMKAGASDYLLKDQLLRLGPAVLGALQKKRLAEARRSAEQALRASEERHRILMEHANDAILLLEPARPGRLIVEINKQAEALLGRPRAEIVGRSYVELVAPQEREETLSRTRQLLLEGSDRVTNRTLLRGDGTRVSVDVSTALVRVGEQTLALSILRDATERNAAEARLRERERLATFTAEVAASLVHEEPLPATLGRCCDAAVRRLDAACARIWTLAPEEDRLQLTASAGLETPLDASRLRTGDLLTGRIAAELQPHVTNDLLADPGFGHPEWARREGLSAFAGYPLVVGGRLLGVVALLARQPLSEALTRTLAVVADQIALAIERKRNQQALREAQQKLQHVVSSSPAVLFSLRPDGRQLIPTWVSGNVQDVLGFSTAEALAPGWWLDNIHPDDRERVLEEETQLSVEDYLAQEYRFATKAGGHRWMRSELRMLRDAAGGPLEVIGSWSDISGRKDAELMLAESEQQYRLLFESNPQPMWVYNEDTLQFLAVNAAALRSYGYRLEEFFGMTILDIRPPLQVLARDPSGPSDALRGPGTTTHRRKDGSLIQVEVTSSFITFAGRAARLALVTDVTEKKTLEVQLNQAQRMESVGRLAGGVAHDFNNLLGVITGYGELLRRRLAEPRLKKYSDDILQAAERAAGLTRQLLAFSRQQVLQPQTLDVNAVVADVEKMLRRLIGEDIALKTALAREPGAVRADRGQLEQVLMNLAVNARDAMPKGGKLTIETAPAELDAAYARTHEGVSPGRYVMMAVSDTGHGMTREVLARVFEPFFTTKGEGKGTGLGLATVYGIVKQSGGHVFVYSEPGQGASFKVYLPRVDSAPAQDARREARPLLRGSETVLLVEDEMSLRELVRECLEDCGYAVVEARQGDEALRLAEAHPGPIHLLLTDVVMPGLGGRDLGERLLPRHPGLKVLYMSGYTDDAVVHHGVLSHEMDFLQKPFTQAALARKVREVLDQPPASPAP